MLVFNGLEVSREFKFYDDFEFWSKALFNFENETFEKWLGDFSTKLDVSLGGFI